MKVSAINSAFCNYTKYLQNSGVNNLSTISTRQINNYQSYQPNFGIANSAPIKTLFKYGLPCMYSGIEMINATEVQKLLKRGVFNDSAADSVKAIGKYKHSIKGKEKKVYSLLKIHALMMKEKNLKGVLQKLSPFFEKLLVGKQMHIFAKLSQQAQEMPSEQLEKFNQLMSNTIKKIHKEPVVEKFGHQEFMYKLQKIKGNVAKLSDNESNHLMNLLLKESLAFSKETTPETLANQKKVISSMEKIINSTCLGDNYELLSLIQTSKDKLNSKPTLIPFSRKAFIYDLNSIIENIPDKNLYQKMTQAATKLPTSETCLSAYIVKIAKEPSEKIAYRLLWPSFASVEHILPHSCGGKDEMANFGGATTRENSLRQSIDFTEQMKYRPKTAKYCQKYVNKLIELAHKGVFKKHKIDTQYIEDFKNTIYAQSKGKIKLDTSKL